MKATRILAALSVPALAFSLSAVGPAAAAPASERPVSAAAIPTDRLDPGHEAGTAIVNGEPASYEERPSLITGLRVGGGGPQGTSCTASVVGTRTILTAAHCLVDAEGDKSYLYGDDDLNSSGDELWQSEVTEFVAHPGYTGPGGWQTGYDVAVATVAADIPVAEADWAQFATSADEDLTQPGKEGTAYGYGFQSVGGTIGVLQKTTLPINDAGECQVFDIQVNPELMICTGYDDGRTGICSGDSGGPLVVDGVVVGVTSWGSADCDRYGIYAKLTNEMGDWVAETVGGQSTRLG